MNRRPSGDALTAGSVRLLGRWRGRAADMELLEPPVRHRRGRLHHQILGLLVHREQGDLADIGLIGQQHHDAVDAGRRAAVRRRAELERVQHAAEPGLDLCRRIAGHQP